MFVTVGYEKFPFDRLVRIIDKAVGENIIPDEAFIQTGHSHYLPRFCKWKSFLKFDEMVNFMEKSEIIVTHAGVGSTFLCLDLGKFPLLFPRKSRFGEHIDNHQVDFAKKMEGQARVLVAYDESELVYKICHYKLLIRSLSMPSVSSGKTCLLTHLKKILDSNQKARRFRE